MTAREYDINGYYSVARNPISRVGVFPYTAKSVGFPGWEADPTRRIMVYRPEHELANPDTVESFKLVPWLNDHTMVGDPENEPGLTPVEEIGASGTTGERVEYDPQTRTLYANLRCWGKRLAALIDAGKKELSLGFRCVYEFTEGNFEGQAYQAIQRTIRGNHNASVWAGRMGPGVAVLDFAIDAEEFAPMKKTLRQRLMASGKLPANATPEQVMAALDAEEDAPVTEGGITLESVMAALKPLAEIQAGIAALAPAGMDPDMEPVLDEAGKPKMGTDGKPMFAKKKATDATPPAAMDAVAKRLKTAEDAIAAFGKTPAVTPKTIMAELAMRDALVAELTPFVGTFDHSAMTLPEVAKYGVDKLELKGVEGQEFVAVKSWLMGRTPPAAAKTFALDGAAAPAGANNDPLKDYLSAA